MEREQSSYRSKSVEESSLRPATLILSWPAATDFDRCPTIFPNGGGEEADARLTAAVVRRWKVPRSQIGTRVRALIHCGSRRR